MKRIELFLLAIAAVFSLMTACEENKPDAPSTENPSVGHLNSDYWFTQTLEMNGKLAEDLVGIPTRDLIFIIWEGEGIESIRYDYFESHESKDISDDDIRKNLTKEVDDRDMQRLKEERVINEFFDSKPETEYEVVSLATFKDGTTKLCRDIRMSNDSLPNRFEQYLELPYDGWTEQMPDNTVCAYYDGNYVKAAKNGIFLASESASISDEDIVDMLTYEFTDDDLLAIYNFSIAGPCCIFFKDLEFNTTYEVVAFATFDDGKTQLCRGTIKTGNARQ